MGEAAALRWVDGGHFGHEGLFVGRDEDDLLCVLRFYPDGRVASVSGDIGAEHSYVFSWLRPDDPAASSGCYDVGPDRTLRFSLTSGALRSSGPVPVVVDCEARWEGEALVVRSESRATGYRATTSYQLVQIYGMTTLDASA